MQRFPRRGGLNLNEVPQLTSILLLAIGAGAYDSSLLSGLLSGGVGSPGAQGVVNALNNQIG